MRYKSTLVRELRQQLMQRLGDYVRDNDLTHKEAAARLHAQTYQVNNILKLQTESLTIDRLVELCELAGIEVTFKAAKKGGKRGRVKGSSSGL